MFKMKMRHFVVGTALLAMASAPAIAADKNYTKGSVWRVDMIRVDPGRMDDYIDSLKAEYTTVMEQAIKEKVILSYKIMVGDSANPQDWDVLILIEAPNWASIDTAEAKFDAIGTKLRGSMEKSDAMDKEAMADRAKIRHIFGGKAMQEIHYVK
ncbi:MAG: hypothetical protein JSS42_12390 [Proteobacteria bacterium]|uniref:hypothetical protein n=1 Tax=Rudaea sp. TaxID=2136325 RepID=UPI00321F87F8|nr:hypothetical protein [Pseudomonadota bacterium]